MKPHNTPTSVSKRAATRRVFSTIASLFLGCIVSAPALHAVAFSGAQGYGANAAGGTTVTHVTNLNNTGAGSLRAALSASGRRVVFDVAGTINITSALVIPNYTTIDGTTAPSPGITVHGYNTSVSGRHDIVVRNLRFREDSSGPSGKCSFQGADACYNIILDHCSVEWGRWDTISFTGNSHDITIQYCILGESIDPQYFGSLMDACDRVSIHHNLFIDNQSRNPKLKSNSQYINNVIYNWGSGGLIGGHSAGVWKSDVINNYFIAGPGTLNLNNWVSDCTATDTWYQAGNYYDLNLNGTRNGSLIPASAFTAKAITLVSAKQHNPSPAVTVSSVTYTADQALSGNLGCQPNDSVDTRLVGYLRSYGTQGQIGKP
jgi:pectate lyase